MTVGDNYPHWSVLFTKVTQLLRKTVSGQTVGLASLFYRRYLNINTIGDSLCSQA